MATEGNVPITAGSGTAMDVVQFGSAPVINREVVTVGDASTQANFLAISSGGAASVNQVRSGTGTQTGVAASATSVTVLASNASRLGASIANDISSSTLYIRLSSTAASIASGGYSAMIQPGGYYEVPANYTGQITGIWASATGYVNVTELT